MISLCERVGALLANIGNLLDHPRKSLVGIGIQSDFYEMHSFDLAYIDFVSSLNKLLARRLKQSGVL